MATQSRPGVKNIHCEGPESKYKFYKLYDLLSQLLSFVAGAQKQTTQ